LRFIEWWNVALDAGNIMVAGDFPFLVMRPHNVAAVSAEDSGFRCLFDTPDTENENNESDQQDFVKAQFSKEDEELAQRQGARRAFHADLLPGQLVNL
jgi:hypothetical protein